MVPIIPMLLLVIRAAEFVFYHLLLSFVDRVSGLPRDMTVPEAMRLYRENIALKAQLEALERHLVRVETKRKRISLGVRAAQVLAYLLTRGDEPFQRYFLSAPRTTIMRWAMRFRSLRRRTLSHCRPPLDDTIAELIVTLKRENPAWGQRRIRDELRRMGIRVSEPSVVCAVARAPVWNARCSSRRFAATAARRGFMAAAPRHPRGTGSLV